MFFCLSGCAAYRAQGEDAKNDAGASMVRVSGDVTVTAAGREGF